MKTFFLLALSFSASIALLSCTKNNDSVNHSVSCDLPSTSVPSELVGNWSNGYNSSTDLVDAYSGLYTGNEF